MGSHMRVGDARAARVMDHAGHAEGRIGMKHRTQTEKECEIEECRKWLFQGKYLASGRHS
jgi:hypothetical protein